MIDEHLNESKYLILFGLVWGIAIGIIKLGIVGGIAVGIITAAMAWVLTRRRPQDPIYGPHQ